MSETILAERELLGFPGARVEIRMGKDNVRTIVFDERGETELPAEAYFHPFAFGYVYPEREHYGNAAD